jgi:hypothetical protein
MRHRAFRLVGAALVTACTLVLSSIGALADEPKPFDPDAIQPTTVSFGGAEPLPTTLTVKHWQSEQRNQNNGIIYRYNMVGVDPDDPKTPNGSATIGVDIIPLDLTVDGIAFKGSDRADAVLHSPLFDYTGDYAWTRAVTHANGTPWFRPAPLSQFPLSANNTGQLLDATMRSQFNKVFPDPGYHLFLAPTLHSAVSIDVSGQHGVTAVTSRGMAVAGVDVPWLQARLQNLIGRLHLDPTRLAVFLTKDVLLFIKDGPARICCVLGGHGAGHVTGGDNSSVSGNGNQPVQTFVWSSWMSPGVIPENGWINKDISGLTHEITEWANDPFNTNTVQPWTAPNAPQYGCSDLLEVGDPTFNLGFGIGHNTFDPAVLPDGSSTDGLFHIQDEVFLPWFMHIAAPNDISQPAQVTKDGRYTFMGDLNPFKWFHGPADTC